MDMNFSEFLDDDYDPENYEEIKQTKPLKLSQLKLQSVDLRKSLSPSVSKPSETRNNKSEIQSKEFLDSIYRIEKKLGMGGFGVVYKAIDKQTGELFAIKQISKKNKNLNKDVVSLILNEIEINIILFDCEYIVKMKRNFQTEDSFYLVFEYSNMGDLYYEMERHYKQNRSEPPTIFIPEKQIKNIIRDVCKALKCCHKNNVCHNDIKPENILMFRNPKEPNEYIYKLCDLGLSTKNRNKKEKIQVGTRGYIAPEIWNNEEGYCDKTDLWALGILIYQLFTYENILPDTKSEFLSQLNYLENKFRFKKQISEEAKSLILGLLKVKPEERLTIEGVLNHPFLK